MDIMARMEILRAQILRQEAGLTTLKSELSKLESQLLSSHNSTSSDHQSTKTWPWPLEAEEYTRYGRQMILPDVGLPGQLRLRASKVLIIGVGGLGCPAAAYLAGAGIDILGLVDGDEVEMSNLHRQILHSASRIGLKKVDSAATALRSINPLPKYITYPTHLDPLTALQIFREYDLILDCTDTPQTRYLISDVAVLCGKPLISASALRTDGQLIILNHPPTPPIGQRSTEAMAGPCYRCVFPRPPPPESVTSCGEGGILGPVVGVMGVLMALEAIKLLTSGSISLIEKQDLFSLPSASTVERQPTSTLTMLSASGTGPTVFRNIRLKGKRNDCAACSKNASITAEHMISGDLDYSAFCGTTKPISVLTDEQRIDVKTMSKTLIQSGTTKPDGRHLKIGSSSVPDTEHTNVEPVNRSTSDMSLVLDVRDEAQFSICSLPGSINIPWNTLSSYRSRDDESAPLLKLTSQLQKNPASHIYTICRLGNDSQLAVRKLQELGIVGDPEQIKDVIGGFKLWKRDVDKDWPEY